MSPNRAGGIASIICASTYIFGFVFFFGVLDAPIDNSDTGRLQFLVGQRDVFFLGYIISGVVFSLSLLLVNQSLHRIFKNVSPAIASYNATLGVIWASFVLASTFVFLVSLSFLAGFGGFLRALASRAAPPHRRQVESWWCSIAPAHAVTLLLLGERL